MNGSSNEVTLWAYREGDESEAVLNNKIDVLLRRALQNQINISDYKLEKLRRTQ